jgi:DNA-binding PadR family transcriptional regulator
MREEGIATQNCIVNETLKGTVIEDLEERLIKNFLDVIILKAVKDELAGGYDILSLMHRKFGVLLSAGSIYSVLYSLERKGLVKARINQRARCYTLTEKGEVTLCVIMATQDRIKAFFGSIF